VRRYGDGLTVNLDFDVEGLFPPTAINGKPVDGNRDRRAPTAWSKDSASFEREGRQAFHQVRKFIREVPCDDSASMVAFLEGILGSERRRN
jgi:hypothetical protein